MGVDNLDPNSFLFEDHVVVSYHTNNEESQHRTGNDLGEYNLFNHGLAE